MIDFKYQQDAIQQIVTAIEFASSNNQNVSFKAPTGSGKTFIVSQVIKQLTGFTVLWVSTSSGGLPEQTRKSLTTTLPALRVGQLTDAIHGTNLDVCVFGFSEVVTGANSEYKNKATREGEQPNFWNYLQTVKQSGNKLLVVVDEAHIGIKTEDASGTFLQDIGKIVLFTKLEVTATPKPNRDGITVDVNVDDVIDSGMLKQNILINPAGTQETINTEEDSVHLIIKEAWSKILELRKAYEKENSPVRPLLLIQLPNKGQAMDRYNQVFKEYLATQNVTVENGKIGEYYAEERKKSTKNDALNHADRTWLRDTVRNNNSTIEALFFKTALATGWDCPRAQILLTPRNTNSATAAIQIAGRILRHPEPQRNYNNPALHSAYIYTDIQNPIWEDHFGETSDTPIRISFTTPRKPQHTNLNLTFETTRPINEDRPELNPERFTTNFMKAAQKHRLKQQYETSGNNTLTIKSAVSDTKEWVDDDEKVVVTRTGTQNVNQDRILLEIAFDKICDKPFNGFIKPTTGTIKQALYTLLEPDSDLEMKRKLTHPETQTVFQTVLAEAAKETGGRYRTPQPYIWELPEHNRSRIIVGTEPVESKNYLYTKLYPGKESTPEKIIRPWIDAQPNVQWWWKNYDSGADGFNVTYFQTKWKGFYPDYLIQTDDTLWIVEAKSADDLKPEETIPKHAALETWAQKQTGTKTGIVTVTSAGNIMIHQHGPYQPYNTQHNTWKQWAL